MDTNNNTEETNANEAALRQRLYVDTQRPRPFYRTSDPSTHVVNEEIIHQNPPSLQVKIELGNQENF